MPELFPLGPTPTDAEVQSFVDGYAGAPWHEHNDPEKMRDYLASYRETGAVALGMREAGHEPYLYTHIRVYDDVDSLIEDEFTGPDAFYQTTDPDSVRQALAGQEKVCYVSNVNADKNVLVDETLKPRLKEFSTIIDSCFDEYGAGCVTYFTHPETGVYRATDEVYLPGYDIQKTYFPVKPSDHNDIEKLVLVVLTPKAAEATALRV